MGWVYLFEKNSKHIQPTESIDAHLPGLIGHLSVRIKIVLRVVTVLVLEAGRGGAGFCSRDPDTIVGFLRVPGCSRGGGVPGEP